MKATTRKLSLLLVDIVLVNIAIYLALYFRFDGNIDPYFLNFYINSALYITIIKVLVYYVFGLYNSLWSYASVDELLQVFFATGVESVLSFVYGLVFDCRLPRTVYVAAWILTFLFLGGFRFSYRIGRRIRNITTLKVGMQTKILIIGAGEAGAIVIKELRKHDELGCIPVAVIDDDPKKHRGFINGVPIKGDRSRIKSIVEEEGIDEIIIAIPSAPRPQLKEILSICKETKCKLKTLPGVFEIINEQVSFKKIRDVKIEDLLGREEVQLNTKEIAGYLKDEVVLVTGGGGSIGSELCRQIARYKPKKLIIFDIYENNAYELQSELLHNFKGKLDLEVLIGSIRDRERLEYIFNMYKPSVVFHAAAHKHVPLMEDSPTEAVKNNVFGTLNVAQCADKHKVKKFVLISTDKAVNPSSIMGATKRIAEMIIQSMDKHSTTEYAAVRFGNVLGSNGSVIPLFKKQIELGGPITVTHPDITRYFMTIPEAVRLVIQAGAMAKGGEIFILDMGEPVRIVNLAEDLIRLSGFEPYTDIDIKFTGLRSGEKLFEELVLESDVITTTHDKIFVEKPIAINHKEVLLSLKSLESNINSTQGIINVIRSLVPFYKCEHNGSSKGSIS